MNNIKIISNWDLKTKIESEILCELYVDALPLSTKSVHRILWVVEPDEVSKLKNSIIQRCNEFDLILTYDEDILATCKNSKFHPHGMTWIDNFDFKKNKEFAVTSLVGGKKLSDNHLLRQELPKIKDKITSIPLHLFNSKNCAYTGVEPMNIMENTDIKNELFYSQFHISIENFSKKNYFSEKLIDCFQTKTIPIYMGCTNIDEFYDSRGMFIVNNINDIIEVCNSLTPDTYHQMLEYVEKNYILSFVHADFRKLLKTAINQFIGISNF
jgi:hypothetical protein